LGGRHKNFRKRWMVLKDHNLFYFKNPSNKDRPMGMFPLEELRAMCKIERGKRNKKNPKWLIELTPNERVKWVKSVRFGGSTGQHSKPGQHEKLVLQAMSKRDMESWYYMIIRNMKEQNPSNGETNGKS